MSGECDMCGEHATDCRCTKEKINMTIRSAIVLLRFKYGVANMIQEFTEQYDIDHDDLVAELKSLILELERDA